MVPSEHLMEQNELSSVCFLPPGPCGIIKVMLFIKRLCSKLKGKKLQHGHFNRVQHLFLEFDFCFFFGFFWGGREWGGRVGVE